MVRPVRASIVMRIVCVIGNSVPVGSLVGLSRDVAWRGLVPVALGKSVMVGRILLSSVVRPSDKHSEILAVSDYTVYSIDNRQTPDQTCALSILFIVIERVQTGKRINNYKTRYPASIVTVIETETFDFQSKTRPRPSSFAPKTSTLRGRDQDVFQGVFE